jgi:site-specific DNA-methyltransferase (adenine-specific)
MTKNKLSDYRPQKKNANKHTQRGLSMLEKSIQEGGFIGAMTSAADGEIFDGSARIETVATVLPTDPIVVDSDGTRPIIVRRTDIPNADDPKAKRLALMANRTAQVDLDWDAEVLKELSEEIEIGDIFSEKELIEIGFDEKEIVEDEIPEVPKVAKTVLGDLYELGRHRLLCGDSTNSDDVAKLMDGKKAVLYATDPPYGVGYNDETGSKKKAKIQNDENDGIKLQRFLESVFASWLPFIEKNAAWYLWHAQMTQGFFTAAAAAAAVIIHRQIIWVKPSLIMGHGDYHWRHELCFYGWIKGNRPNWYADRKQDTIWEIGRETDKTHPTAKPVEIFIRPMKHNTKESDVCAEPFAGSGSQFIAAEQTKRICYGMELEPKYCDVIVSRYVKFTGNNKIKRNGIEIEWKVD